MAAPLLHTSFGNNSKGEVMRRLRYLSQVDGFGPLWHRRAETVHVDVRNDWRARWLQR
jgi:hypothetical protein